MTLLQTSVENLREEMLLILIEVYARQLGSMLQEADLSLSQSSCDQTLPQKHKVKIWP